MSQHIRLTIPNLLGVCDGFEALLPQVRCAIAENRGTELEVKGATRKHVAEMK
jgi:hypothetical protein